MAESISDAQIFRKPSAKTFPCSLLMEVYVTRCSSVSFVVHDLFHSLHVHYRNESFENNNVLPIMILPLEKRSQECFFCYVHCLINPFYRQLSVEHTRKWLHVEEDAQRNHLFLYKRGWIEIALAITAEVQILERCRQFQSSSWLPPDNLTIWSGNLALWLIIFSISCQAAHLD